MKPYDPKQIEPKWQKIWQETGLYKTQHDPGRENYYALVMFPYPSGDLHSGHWYNFGPGDTMARFHRMQGKNVLHPMGFDAFGLPAENAAIKRNIPPAEWTEQNIANMINQLKSMGPSYDWDKLINTSKPDYYRWTQWLFLFLYKNGLAYRAKGLQNWCPKDQTVLANEQTISESGEKNVCVRCGTPVVKKELEQWFFKITDYADRLLSDLDKVEWPEKVKTMQENWIGRSVGAEIEFKIANDDSVIEVFTTRPDTLFGATYLVLAPEHPLVAKITATEHRSGVTKYQNQVAAKTELARLEEKEKSGVFTGAYAVNPINHEKIPVWIADYVLMGYGTGAIMAVPAHDERDFEFGKKFQLPIRRVVNPPALLRVTRNFQDEHLLNVQGDVRVETALWTGEGELINSGQFDGLAGTEAKHAIVEYLFQDGRAKTKTQYRLRDWLISRQRYWGAPIPMVYCDHCGVQPVPEDQLPVELPLDVEFEPTGKSPLASRPDFFETTCPKCGKPARRETDTMDTFVDSSWYFLRYPNTKFSDGPFDPAAVKAWLPVDQYMGGVEHAILHLLYARFVTKALYDYKQINFDEPFKRLFNQGMILGPDGQKMSKSRGNVVNPDDYVSKYGADTFRMYLMFMGPYDQGGPFDTQGIAGVYRFLTRVWGLIQDFSAEASSPSPNTELETALISLTHKTIKKVTADTASFGFNTAIAALMEHANDLAKFRRDLPFGTAKDSWKTSLSILLQLLAPYAPHITEELWHELGNENSIHVSGWPEYREDLVKEDLVEIIVQVNGKLRATMTLPVDTEQADLEKLAAQQESIKRHLEGQTIVKTIVVPRKLVNFVVKS